MKQLGILIRHDCVFMTRIYQNSRSVRISHNIHSIDLRWPILRSPHTTQCIPWTLSPSSPSGETPDSHCSIHFRPVVPMIRESTQSRSLDKRETERARARERERIERLKICNGEVVDARPKWTRFGYNALSRFRFFALFFITNSPFGPVLSVIEEGAIDQQLQFQGRHDRSV